MTHGSPCCGAHFHQNSIARQCTQLVLLFFGCVCTLVAAQTPAQTPAPVSFMAYASVEEKTLFVHGGRTNYSSGISFNQFFSLDLTQSGWNTSNPPWKTLSTRNGSLSSPTDYEHAMTVSKGNENLIIWGYDSGLAVYNIPSNSWVSNSSLPAGSTLKLDGIRVVTDPVSGLIYAPSGANHSYSMMRYDLANNIVTMLPMPDILLGWQVTYYSAVWSTQRNSMLMYGGATFTTPKTAHPYFFEFFPSNNSWNLIGDYPGDLNSQCMIPAYNGTKMIVFGGEDIAFNPFGAVYILDVATLSWTRVSSISPQTQNRADMACAVAGDNFLAWGGDQDFKIGAFGTPVIFNLKTNQWTTQYIASFPDASGAGSGSSGSFGSPNTTPPTDSSSSPKSSNVVTIASAVAVVVVVATVIVFVYRRRSRSPKQQHSNNSRTSLSVAVKNDNDLELNKMYPAVSSTESKQDRAPQGHQPSITRAPERDLYSTSTIVSGGDNSTLVGSPVARYHHLGIANSSTYSPSETSSPTSPHTLPAELGSHNAVKLRSPQGMLSPKQPQTLATGTNSGAILLEEQIAQTRAQHELQYRQHQEYLEHLRLQQQAELEALQLQLNSTNCDQT
ncbi:hypothetical protein BGX21_008435 [Mortierella sp. AD011]|nr:hypothetical protein BGX21_008435 [Mortierella sp. AD011]